MPLSISFLLLAAGILAIYVEIFVPAAGLIGLAGGGMIVAGVVLAYANHGLLDGSIVLISSLVATPLSIVLGLKLFPRTLVGRRLILGPTPADPERPPAGAPGAADLHPGAEGEAITVLRPSGMARIANRRVSVVTTGDFVEQGERILVVRVEGSRVVVRRLAPEGARTTEGG